MTYYFYFACKSINPEINIYFSILNFYIDVPNHLLFYCQIKSSNKYRVRISIKFNVFTTRNT